MSDLTQADIDAAEKRGRAIGTANASRAYQASLPEVVRRLREAAWDEGADAVVAAFATRTEVHNPYRATATKEIA